MLKFALMAGAAMIAAPAMAQQQPAPAAPTTTADSPAGTPIDQASPTAGTSTAATAGQSTATADTTASAATTGTAASGAAQVAQVVETEFPTYDKNADGSLSATEFGSWMLALRSASDASVKAGSKEMKSWTATAFAQADTDKSKSVSKAELTGFLAKGQS